ncbi:matrin-3-like [Hypomesus transpacificus]|uniref:matrin-3-like n=1 Tax=Hypomesus transpacificus TaxID=137520 RepID=UPI001F078248|nr:matrin-3-like [Hypomesus transpacificus]XP_046899082.1 matrin-3-like [Hypomesus transpacificus]
MEASGHPCESDTSTHLQGSGDAPMSTMNLYATLGLSPEDVDALAQIPESEISVETLPILIMQLKAKRAQEEARQRDVSPKREIKKEHADSRDNRKEVSPTYSEPHRPNCHGDTDYRRVVSYKRLERPEKMEGRRDSRHSRPPRDKLSDSRPEGRPKFPMSYEVDDFCGVTPKELPHKCSLCLCMVNSKTTWTSHLHGLRHAEGKRRIMRLYPEWEIPESTNMPDNDDHSPPRKVPRLAVPFKKPHSSDRLSGGEVWPLQKRLNLKPKTGTKVVVTKYPLGVVSVDHLLSLAKPYGTVVKHLVFPTKGFLEFSSHKEAVNMVKQFGEKPSYVRNHKLTMYLSPTVCSIHTPRLDEPETRHSKRVNNAVVCFSHLPPGKEQEAEILELAKMFGSVQHSIFSSDQALIEMVDWKDADIMVKYYRSNPLKINGKGVKVSLSSTRKRIRESPESTTSRRADSSKSHCSKHKSTETGETSANQEKNMVDTQPAEEMVNVKEESHESTLEDHKEDDTESENIQLEEEEGMMVEDEQSLLDDIDTETGADVNVDKTDSCKSASPVTDAEEKKGLENIEPSDQSVIDSDQKAANDPNLCDHEDTMEQEIFHEDDEDVDDMNFPENIDDFVTLDELDEVVEEDESLGSDKTQDGKVVLVKPIRRSYGLEDALFQLAKPFGKVVNHVISFYRDEARLELESSEQAHEMVKALRDHRKSLLFGKLVSVVMCGDVKDLKDGKVVIIQRIRRAYGLEKALFKLAEPFGKVVNHIVSFYRQEARLQMESSEQAHEMVKALRDHKKSQLFGKHVSVVMCGELKELAVPSGRSIYIGMLPMEKYSDISLLRLAQPFGKITGYNLNWRHRKCYIQMETVEAAQKMLKKYELRPPRFYGTTLKICLCRKGDSLIPWNSPVKYELWLARKNSAKALQEDQGGEGKGVQSSTSSTTQRSSMEEDGSMSESEGVCGDPECDQSDAASEDLEQEEPLGPYQPNKPVGLDYLVQRTGLFCKLCNIFYTNEKTAKSVHCSSKEHYENLKRKVEGEKQPLAD